VFGLVPVIRKKRWRLQKLPQFEGIDWSQGAKCVWACPSCW